MDKRSLLAIVLSILILIAYQELISYLYPPSRKAVPPPPAELPSPTAPLTPQPLPAEGQTQYTEAPEVVPAPVHAIQNITVENDVFTAIFTSLGGRLKSLRLKNYPGDEGRESPPREMVREDALGQLPLGIKLEGNGVVISDDAVLYEVRGSNIDLHAEEKATLELRGKSQSGVIFTKIFSFSGNSYGMTLEVHVEGAPRHASSLSLVWLEGIDPHQNSSRYAVHGPVALVGRKFRYISASATREITEVLGPDRIRWAGYADTYFLAAMIPPEGDKHSLLLNVANRAVETKLTTPWNGEQVTYTLYIGPKEFTALNAVNPALDRAIDFGWSHFIARPLVSMLRFSHSLTGNYGIDIILLTLLVKVLFFPLSNKSFKSMSDMRKLQPQLERLRAQYKDDRERLNKEMMELYRRYKINPLGGCLPMLVQLPVFIGLYQALSYAIELRQAPFFGWIQDLSQPDRLGSIGLPFIEPPGIPVLTLLMGGTMFVQQAITPVAGDPTQQKMMMFMPLIFTIMFVNFPSGLVLYWLVNNVLSIAQQYWYTKKFAD